MPVLQAIRKKKFVKSKVVLANHKKLVPAEHTKSPITKSNAKISTPTCMLKM